MKLTIELFEKTSDAGLTSVHMVLRELYYNGKEIEKNLEKAKKFCMKAIKDF